MWGLEGLKYIMSILLSNFEHFFEKKFHLSTRVWISILRRPKLLLSGQNFGAKGAKKCCHEGTFEAFHLWTLAISVKAEKLTSSSPPIKLLDFFHLLVGEYSVKIS